MKTLFDIVEPRKILGFIKEIGLISKIWNDVNTKFLPYLQKFLYNPSIFYKLL